MEIVGRFRGMLLRENVYFPDLHVCILICFKAHKLDKLENILYMFNSEIHLFR